VEHYSNNLGISDHFKHMEMVMISLIYDALHLSSIIQGNHSMPFVISQRSDMLKESMTL